MLGKSSKDRTPQPTPAAGSAVPSQSVIGQGMAVTGDCTTEGHVRIQGTVTGSVTASGLELAESGLVDGDIGVPASGKKGQVFVVAGRVTGRVKAHIVEVQRTGCVLGGIEAEEATIHGTVEGGAEIGQRLAVMSTAVVSGDVRTNRLSMEDGGRVNGTIRMGSDAKGKRVSEGSAPRERDTPTESVESDLTEPSAAESSSEAAA